MSETGNKLTELQLARCERNRKKALLLRKSRLANQEQVSTSVKTLDFKKVIDSGAGFLIDYEKNEEPAKIVEDLAPFIEEDRIYMSCDECGKTYEDSFLFENFQESICNLCKNNERFSLITKTNVKNDYLLSDAHLFDWEPPLKFITKKNPRNNHWGDMKLFLQIQIEKRALEVWGSPEAIEEEKELREGKREVQKKKKYYKKMNQLRKEVRSSLYTIKNKQHEHEYVEEQIDEDNWKKTCTSCQHEIIYEKM